MKAIQPRRPSEMTPVQPSEHPALVYLASLQTALNTLAHPLGFEPVHGEQRGKCQTHVPVPVS